MINKKKIKLFSFLTLSSLITTSSLIAINETKNQNEINYLSNIDSIPETHIINPSSYTINQQYQINQFNFNSSLTTGEFNLLDRNENVNLNNQTILPFARTLTLNGNLSNNSFMDHTLEFDLNVWKPLGMDEDYFLQNITFDISNGYVKSRQDYKSESRLMNYNISSDNFVKGKTPNNFNNLAIEKETIIGDTNPPLPEKKLIFNVLNYDVEHKSLIKSNKQIEKHFQTKTIKINRLNYRQFEALNSFLPKINDSLIEHIGREIPSKTLANGYPFLDNILSDNNGLILGTNWLKEPIIFDQFKLDQNRKNHNMVILGLSGSGKSYLTKKMINWFAMTNKKVFILDVEREYKNICQNYDGNWIDIGTGTNGIINPLEIIIVDNDLSTNDLVLNHILALESFFQILFSEITNQQLRYLTNIIKQYYFDYKYNEKKIKELEPNEWPTFDDLYQFAISKQNKISKSYSDLDVQYVHELLRSELSSDGRLAHLYNEHSSINISKKLACFDLNSLFEKNNNRITQAQLFLTLNYIQNEVRENDYSKDPIVIIIDEAHLLIDENNPIALDFVFQMVKRIRKRNGAIIIISQNPDDFMANENVAKKTKAILNNSQYSLFFNLSPNNVKDVVEMYKSYGSGISEDEKLFIAKAKRGQALFFVSGFDRHKLDIFVSDVESKNFS